MKVPDVRRNLVPDTCSADGEGALPANWVRFSWQQLRWL